MRSQTKASGGLRDYTLVSESRTNMEGKMIDRLPARASQSLRLLGVTSSRYRMGLRASNSTEPDREPEEQGLEHRKPDGQLAEMQSQMKASGGLRDYTLVS